MPQNSIHGNDKAYVDPYNWIISLALNRVAKILYERNYPVEASELRSLVEEPSVEAYGDFSLPLFGIARRFKVNPVKLADEVAGAFKRTGYIREVKHISGYLNFYIDYVDAAKLLIEAVRRRGVEYGYVPVDKPKRIVIEHTSANPIHPLHIGHARNSVLGDTLARLLKRRGHIVQTTFYVNDLGRQVAILLYGYLNAGKPKPPPNIKVDHWLGQLYAITNTLIEVYELKKKIEEVKKRGSEEEYRELVAQLDKLLGVANELRLKNKELFDLLAERLRDRDNERSIQELMVKLEHRIDEELAEGLREVIDMCLQGFKDTLSKLEVFFDKWDYESSITWRSLVRKIIDEAKQSILYTIQGCTSSRSYKAFIKGGVP